MNYRNIMIPFILGKISQTSSLIQSDSNSTSACQSASGCCQQWGDRACPPSPLRLKKKIRHFKKKNIQRRRQTKHPAAHVGDVMDYFEKCLFACLRTEVPTSNNAAAKKTTVPQVWGALEGSHTGIVIKCFGPCLSLQPAR